MELKKEDFVKIRTFEDRFYLALPLDFFDKKEEEAIIPEPADEKADMKIKALEKARIAKAEKKRIATEKEKAKLDAEAAVALAKLKEEAEIAEKLAKAEAERMAKEAEEEAKALAIKEAVEEKAKKIAEAKAALEELEGE